MAQIRFSICNRIAAICKNISKVLVNEHLSHVQKTALLVAMIMFDGVAILTK